MARRISVSRRRKKIQEQRIATIKRQAKVQLLQQIVPGLVKEKLQ